MKIQNTLNKIQKYIDVRKYEKYQKDLNEHVSLHYEEVSPAIQELYTARELLANYAKHNLVSIDIYDKTPAAKLREMSGLTDDKKDLYVRVTDIFTGRMAESAHPSDTGVIYPKEKFAKIMVHDTYTGTERIADVKSSTQDTFLRHFYRKVESLTSKVRNKNNK